jgi:hypothetical protein
MVILATQLTWTTWSVVQTAKPGIVLWPAMVMGSHTSTRTLPNSLPNKAGFIALKLHVIKQGIPHRMLGDMDDVINLLLANHVDLRQENWRQLFVKYGNLDLYEKVARAIAP